MSRLDRHARRVPGGVLLSDRAAVELLGLLDNPSRLAALGTIGSQAASLLGAIGRAASATASGSDHAVESRSPAPLWSDDLLDAAAAAELFGCTPRNVRGLAHRGTLPGIRRTGRWIFLRSTIEAHLRSRG